MATRKDSHILSIVSDENAVDKSVVETAIESLLSQRTRLLLLLDQLDADLISLGHNPDEQQT